MITKTLVFVPTYNEAENVVPLCEQIQALNLDLDLLFLDDNSPDGTGEVLDGLARQYSNVTVLHRTGKRGIGSAHAEGIQWAYDRAYSTLITMDCDFTHPPEKIPSLLALKEQHDVVVGSRYMQAHSLSGWNPVRKLLTWTGHALTVSLLGMPYDATGAFRLYRLDRIPRYGFGSIQSNGYSFFFESLYVLFRNNISIGECPIALPPRTYGHSKMSYREVGRSVKLLAIMSLIKTFNPERFEFCEPFGTSADVPADRQGWDDYWQKQEFGAGLLYDTIAAFYRKVIIRPTLNHFVRTYFQPGSRVLHAGCGSGQVDVDIRKDVHITGLDISINALRFYRRTNKGACDVLHGSILNIPLPADSMDGVYNLGVMEHFTTDEIAKSLRECFRVLRPGGRMIVFWPPEFGVSVITFKIVKGFLEKVLRRRNVKLHPDEVTRVRSKRHVAQLFEEQGFELLHYYFGMRDAFTYSVIVVEKPGPTRSESVTMSRQGLSQSAESISAARARTIQS